MTSNTFVREIIYFDSSSSSPSSDHCFFLLTFFSLCLSVSIRFTHCLVSCVSHSHTYTCITEQHVCKLIDDRARVRCHIHGSLFVSCIRCLIYLLSIVQSYAFTHCLFTPLQKFERTECCFCHPNISLNVSLALFLLELPANFSVHINGMCVLVRAWSICCVFTLH